MSDELHHQRAFRLEALILHPLGYEFIARGFLLNDLAGIEHVLASKLLRFVGRIAVDYIHDAQMLVIHSAGIARGTDGHAQRPVALRQTDENAVSGEMHDLKVKGTVHGAHLLDLSLPRKIPDAIGHGSQGDHVILRNASTSSARGQALEAFPHFAGLDKAQSVQLSDKDAQPFNQFDEAEPFELQ